MSSAAQTTTSEPLPPEDTTAPPHIENIIRIACVHLLESRLPTKGRSLCDQIRAWLVPHAYRQIRYNNTRRPASSASCRRSDSHRCKGLRWLHVPRRSRAEVAESRGKPENEAVCGATTGGHTSDDGTWRGGSSGAWLRRVAFECMDASTVLCWRE